jgi:hypothetical protein
MKIHHAMEEFHAGVICIVAPPWLIGFVDREERRTEGDDSPQRPGAARAHGAQLVTLDGRIPVALPVP